MKLILFFFVIAIPLFASPKIITRDLVLIDEEIFILVENLPPCQPFTLNSRFTDVKGFDWEASSTYFANEDGVANLSQTPPISGSYRGIDSMGLFCTMMRTDGVPAFPALDNLNMEVTLSLTTYEKVITKVVKRQSLLPQVDVIPIEEEGLYGTLFMPPSDCPQSVVITLSGSNGGTGKGRAALLASHGVATLALGYFSFEGLPKNLENIDLAYFEKVFSWIDDRSELSGKIGLYGVSRGAELALLLGSFFPERISAVLAVVPSSVVWGALGNPREAAWIYEGKPVLPSAPFPMAKLDINRGKDPSDPFSTRHFHMMGRSMVEEWEPAMIPVEKMQGPVLLVSGGDDQMWPSDVFAADLAERLESASIPHNHLLYPEAGHGITVPYLPRSNHYLHPHVQRWFSLGGSRKGDEMASRDFWLKGIEFFRKWSSEEQ